MDTEEMLRAKLHKAGKKIFTLKQKLMDQQIKTQKTEQQLEALQIELHNKSEEIVKSDKKYSYLEKILEETRDSQNAEIETYQAEYTRILQENQNLIIDLASLEDQLQKSA